MNKKSSRSPRTARRGPWLIATVLGLLLAVTSATAVAQTAPESVPLTPMAEHATKTIQIAPNDSPIERSTGHIAVAPNAVWVVFHRAGYVARIDPKTNKVVARVSLPVPGCVPHGCAGLENVTATRDSVWVANNQTGELVHIDAHTNKVVAKIPARIEDDPVVYRDSIWVTRWADSGDLVKIDAKTNKVTATVHIDRPYVLPLAVIDGKLWASGTSDQGGVETDLLVRIDPDTGTVEAEFPAIGGYQAAVGAGDLWLERVHTAVITRADGRTGTSEQDVHIGLQESFAMASGGGSIWVRSQQPDRLVRIDVNENRVTEVIELPTTEFQTGIAYGHGSLWVSDWSAGAVYRIKP